MRGVGVGEGVVLQNSRIRGRLLYLFDFAFVCASLFSFGAVSVSIEHGVWSFIHGKMGMSMA